MVSFEEKVNVSIFQESTIMHASSAKTSTSGPLVDQYSRTISYLRLSITDRCNLRCLYCTPASNLVGCADLLSYEELLRIVNVAVKMGMNKLRLTGGEPLIRKGVMEFIRILATIEGLEEIRLTTNGVLLKEKGAELYAAGIRSLNISLDSMQPERFKAITGADFYTQVWQGIEYACELGFKVKLNVVAMRGINDDEFADFARLATQMPVQVRFIEFMPIGNKESWDKSRFISAGELREIISKLGNLEPIPGARLDGPARIYRLTTQDGARGKIGFISPISHHFCDQCNRLRLTSEGRLRACLLHDHECDLKSFLRQGGTDDDIRQAIQQTILDKPKGHTLQDDLADGGHSTCQGRMSRIGG